MGMTQAAGAPHKVPNDKILDMTKLKAFADDKLKVAKLTVSLFDKSRKECGKNGGYQHFLLFPHLKAQVINSFPSKPWFLCVCSKVI